jgi:TonB family protein
MMSLQSHCKATIAMAIVWLGFSTIIEAQNVQTEAAKPSPPKIIRKSGGLLQSSAIKRVTPDYPPQAKAAGVEGQVILEVVIDEEGKVMSARTVFGYPLLGDAAAEALWAWAWPSTHLSGVPVKVIGRLAFSFHLSSRESAEKEIDRLKQEISNIRKESRANRNSAELFYQLGLAYERLSSYQDANRDEIEAFEQAASINPDYVEAHYKLGWAYLKRYFTNEAIEAFKRVIRLRPNFAPGYYGLGEAYSNPRYRDQAIETLKGAIKVNPRYAEAYYLLGWNYNQAEQYKEALEALKQATALNSNWAEAHLGLGLTYLKLGDKASASTEQRIIKPVYTNMAAYLAKQINK